MDYAKLLLAYQIRREALIEVRRYNRAQGRDISTVPTGDYEAIVFSILEDLEATSKIFDANSSD